jgi:hypothetical protein
MAIEIIRSVNVKEYIDVEVVKKPTTKKQKQKEPTKPVETIDTKEEPQE